MVKKIDYVKQGKRNKATGARFELKVRKDLESKGWIVSKWQNNVVPDVRDEKLVDQIVYPKRINLYEGKCVPAKPGRFRMMQTGFPDFIVYNQAVNFTTARGNLGKDEPVFFKAAIINFVECKTNGYLTKEEKEKAIFYLNNNYCSKFLIASKGEKRGTIKYTEFKTTN